MRDPLEYLYEKYNFDLSEVANIIYGETYLAIVLKNGQIGLGAVLGSPVSKGDFDFRKPDFGKVEHRIILTAYYNALLNYSKQYNKEIDIFDELDFGHYKNIVMIGLCRPLFKKMQDGNIAVKVFDEGKDDDVLVPMDEQRKHLQTADCIIITSTSVINGSFMELMGNLNDSCDAYLFGPSGLLTTDMFQYKQIKYIFGSIFDKNDERVLNLIRDGQGTPSFSKYMHKVFIQNLTK